MGKQQSVMVTVGLIKVHDVRVVRRRAQTEHIVAHTTVELVIACRGIQHVVTFRAVQRIVARAAFERIIAFAAVQQATAAERCQHIVAVLAKHRFARKHIVASGAFGGFSISDILIKPRNQRTIVFQAARRHIIRTRPAEPLVFKRNLLDTLGLLQTCAVMRVKKQRAVGQSVHIPVRLASL